MKCSMTIGTGVGGEHYCKARVLIINAWMFYSSTGRTNSGLFRQTNSGSLLEITAVFSALQCRHRTTLTWLSEFRYNFTVSIRKSTAVERLRSTETSKEATPSLADVCNQSVELARDKYKPQLPLETRTNHRPFSKAWLVIMDMGRTQSLTTVLALNGSRT